MLEGVDDVGFIDALVSDLVAEGLVAERSVFVTGFSNGGFMASFLADPSSQSRTRWAAVATAAGHEYTLRRASPLAMAMHHCAEDDMVNASGCCAQPPGFERNGRSLHGGASNCCCGIEAATCVSVHELFATWTRINQCKSSKTTWGAAGAQCTVGVRCAKPTSLCLYQHCTHGQWSHDFPAVASILDLFSSEVNSPTRSHYDSLGHGRRATIEELSANHATGDDVLSSAVAGKRRSRTRWRQSEGLDYE